VIEKNVEDFLNYNIKYIELSTAYSLIGVFLFIDLPINYFGWSLGGNVLLVCIIIDALTLTYIIFSIVLSYSLPKRTKPVTLSDFYLLSGIVSVFLTLYFFLWSMCMIEFQGANVLRNFIFFVVIVVFIVMYFVITFIRIRKDAYGNNKSSKKVLKRSNVAIFSLLGAAAAFFVSRTFLSGIDQRSAIYIVCLITFLLASIGSMGLVNFLKYYYIKKYSFDNPVQITLKELRMMKN
jgi:hypothetical protein